MGIGQAYKNSPDGSQWAFTGDGFETSISLRKSGESGSGRVLAFFRTDGTVEMVDPVHKDDREGPIVLSVSGVLYSALDYPPPTEEDANRLARELGIRGDCVAKVNVGVGRTAYVRFDGNTGRGVLAELDGYFLASKDGGPMTLADGSDKSLMPADVYFSGQGDKARCGYTVYSGASLEALFKGNAALLSQAKAFFSAMGYVIPGQMKPGETVVKTVRLEDGRTTELQIDSNGKVQWALLDGNLFRGNDAGIMRKNPAGTVQAPSTVFSRNGQMHAGTVAPVFVAEGDKPMASLFAKDAAGLQYLNTFMKQLGVKDLSDVKEHDVLAVAASLGGGVVVNVGMDRNGKVINAVWGRDAYVAEEGVLQYVGTAEATSFKTSEGPLGMTVETYIYKGDKKDDPQLSSLLTQCGIQVEGKAEGGPLAGTMILTVFASIPVLKDLFKKSVIVFDDAQGHFQEIVWSAGKGTVGRLININGKWVAQTMYTGISPNGAAVASVGGKIYSRTADGAWTEMLRQSDGYHLRLTGGEAGYGYTSREMVFGYTPKGGFHLLDQRLTLDLTLPGNARFVLANGAKEIVVDVSADGQQKWTGLDRLKFSSQASADEFFAKAGFTLDMSRVKGGELDLKVNSKGQISLGADLAILLKGAGTTFEAVLAANYKGTKGSILLTNNGPVLSGITTFAEYVHDLTASNAGAGGKEKTVKTDVGIESGDGKTVTLVGRTPGSLGVLEWVNGQAMITSKGARFKILSDSAVTIGQYTFAGGMDCVSLGAGKFKVLSDTFDGKEAGYQAVISDKVDDRATVDTVFEMRGGKVFAADRSGTLRTDGGEECRFEVARNGDWVFSSISGFTVRGASYVIAQNGRIDTKSTSFNASIADGGAVLYLGPKGFVNAVNVSGRAINLSFSDGNLIGENGEKLKVGNRVFTANAQGVFLSATTSHGVNSIDAALNVSRYDRTVVYCLAAGGVKAFSAGKTEEKSLGNLEDLLKEGPLTLKLQAGWDNKPVSVTILPGTISRDKDQVIVSVVNFHAKGPADGGAFGGDVGVNSLRLIPGAGGDKMNIMWNTGASFSEGGVRSDFSLVNTPGGALAYNFQGLNELGKDRIALFSGSAGGLNTGWTVVDVEGVETVRDEGGANRNLLRFSDGGKELFYGGLTYVNANAFSLLPGKGGGVFLFPVGRGEIASHQDRINVAFDSDGTVALLDVPGSTTLKGVQVFGVNTGLFQSGAEKREFVDLAVNDVRVGDAASMDLSFVGEMGIGSGQRFRVEAGGSGGAAIGGLKTSRGLMAETEEGTNFISAEGEKAFVSAVVPLRYDQETVKAQFYPFQPDSTVKTGPSGFQLVSQNKEGKPFDPINVQAGMALTFTAAGVRVAGDSSSLQSMIDGNGLKGVKEGVRAGVEGSGKDGPVLDMNEVGTAAEALAKAMSGNFAGGGSSFVLIRERAVAAAGLVDASGGTISVFHNSQLGWLAGAQDAAGKVLGGAQVKFNTGTQAYDVESSEVVQLKGDSIVRDGKVISLYQNRGQEMSLPVFDETGRRTKSVDVNARIFQRGDIDKGDSNLLDALGFTNKVEGSYAEGAVMKTVEYAVTFGKGEKSEDTFSHAVTLSEGKTQVSEFNLATGKLQVTGVLQATADGGVKLVSGQFTTSSGRTLTYVEGKELPTLEAGESITFNGIRYTGAESSVYGIQVKSTFMGWESGTLRSSGSFVSENVADTRGWYTRNIGSQGTTDILTGVVVTAGAVGISVLTCGLAVPAVVAAVGLGVSAGFASHNVSEGKYLAAVTDVAVALATFGSGSFLSGAIKAVEKAGLSVLKYVGEVSGIAESRFVGWVVQGFAAAEKAETAAAAVRETSAFADGVGAFVNRVILVHQAGLAADSFGEGEIRRGLGQLAMGLAAFVPLRSLAQLALAGKMGEEGLVISRMTLEFAPKAAEGRAGLFTVLADVMVAGGIGGRAVSGAFMAVAIGGAGVAVVTTLSVLGGHGIPSSGVLLTTLLVGAGSGLSAGFLAGGSPLMMSAVKNVGAVFGLVQGVEKGAVVSSGMGLSLRFVSSTAIGAAQGAVNFARLNFYGLGDLMTVLPSYQKTAEGKWEYHPGDFHILSFDERMGSAWNGASMALGIGIMGPVNIAAATGNGFLSFFAGGGEISQVLAKLPFGHILETTYGVTSFSAVETLVHAATTRLDRAASWLEGNGYDGLAGAVSDLAGSIHENTLVISTMLNSHVDAEFGLREGSRRMKSGDLDLIGRVLDAPIDASPEGFVATVDLSSRGFIGTRTVKVPVTQDLRNEAARSGVEVCLGLESGTPLTAGQVAKLSELAQLAGAAEGVGRNGAEFRLTAGGEIVRTSFAEGRPEGMAVAPEVGRAAFDILSNDKGFMDAWDGRTLPNPPAVERAGALKQTYDTNERLGVPSRIQDGVRADGEAALEGSPMRFDEVTPERVKAVVKDGAEPVRFGGELVMIGKDLGQALDARGEGTDAEQAGARKTLETSGRLKGILGDNTVPDNASVRQVFGVGPRAASERADGRDLLAGAAPEEADAIRGAMRTAKDTTVGDLRKGMLREETLGADRSSGPQARMTVNLNDETNPARNLVSADVRQRLLDKGISQVDVVVDRATGKVSLEFQIKGPDSRETAVSLLGDLKVANKGDVAAFLGTVKDGTVFHVELSLEGKGAVTLVAEGRFGQIVRTDSDLFRSAAGELAVRHGLDVEVRVDAKAGGEAKTSIQIEANTPEQVRSLAEDRPGLRAVLGQKDLSALEKLVGGADNLGKVDRLAFEVNEKGTRDAGKGSRREYSLEVTVDLKTLSLDSASLRGDARVLVGLTGTAVLFEGDKVTLSRQGDEPFGLGEGNKVTFKSVESVIRALFNQGSPETADIAAVELGMLLRQLKQAGALTDNSRIEISRGIAGERRILVETGGKWVDAYAKVGNGDAAKGAVAVRQWASKLKADALDIQTRLSSMKETTLPNGDKELVPDEGTRLQAQAEQAGMSARLEGRDPRTDPAVKAAVERVNDYRLESAYKIALVTKEGNLEYYGGLKESLARVFSKARRDAMWEAQVTSGVKTSSLTELQTKQRADAIRVELQTVVNKPVFAARLQEAESIIKQVGDMLVDGRKIKDRGVFRTKMEELFGKIKGEAKNPDDGFSFRPKVRTDAEINARKDGINKAVEARGISPEQVEAEWNQEEAKVRGISPDHVRAEWSRKDEIQKEAIKRGISPDKVEDEWNRMDDRNDALFRIFVDVAMDGIIDPGTARAGASQADILSYASYVELVTREMEKLPGFSWNPDQIYALVTAEFGNINFAAGGGKTLLITAGAIIELLQGRNTAAVHIILENSSAVKAFLSPKNPLMKLVTEMQKERGTKVVKLSELMEKVEANRRGEADGMTIEQVEAVMRDKNTIVISDFDNLGFALVGNVGTSGFREAYLASNSRFFDEGHRVTTDSVTYVVGGGDKRAGEAYKNFDTLKALQDVPMTFSTLTEVGSAHSGVLTVDGTIVRIFDDPTAYDNAKRTEKDALLIFRSTDISQEVKMTKAAEEFFLKTVLKDRALEPGQLMSFIKGRLTQRAEATRDFDVRYDSKGEIDGYAPIMRGLGLRDNMVPGDIALLVGLNMARAELGMDRMDFNRTNEMRVLETLCGVPRYEFFGYEGEGDPHFRLYTATSEGSEGPMGLAAGRAVYNVGETTTIDYFTGLGMEVVLLDSYDNPSPLVRDIVDKAMNPDKENGGVALRNLSFNVKNVTNAEGFNEFKAVLDWAGAQGRTRDGGRERVGVKYNPSTGEILLSVRADFADQAMKGVRDVTKIGDLPIEEERVNRAFVVAEQNSSVRRELKRDVLKTYGDEITAVRSRGEEKLQQRPAEGWGALDDTALDRIEEMRGGDEVLYIEANNQDTIPAIVDGFIGRTRGITVVDQMAATGKDFQGAGKVYWADPVGTTNEVNQNLARLGRTVGRDGKWLGQGRWAAEFTVYLDKAQITKNLSGVLGESYGIMHDFLKDRSEAGRMNSHVLAIFEAFKAEIDALGGDVRAGINAMFEKAGGDAELRTNILRLASELNLMQRQVQGAKTIAHEVFFNQDFVEPLRDAQVKVRALRASKAITPELATAMLEELASLEKAVRTEKSAGEAELQGGGDLKSGFQVMDEISESSRGRAQELLSGFVQRNRGNFDSSVTAIFDKKVSELKDAKGFSLDVVPDAHGNRRWLDRQGRAVEVTPQMSLAAASDFRTLRVLVAQRLRYDMAPTTFRRGDLEGAPKMVAEVSPILQERMVRASAETAVSKESTRVVEDVLGDRQFSYSSDDKPGERTLTYKGQNMARAFDEAVSNPTLARSLESVANSLGLMPPLAQSEQGRNTPVQRLLAQGASSMAAVVVLQQAGLLDLNAGKSGSPLASVAAVGLALDSGFVSGDQSSVSEALRAHQADGNIGLLRLINEHSGAPSVFKSLLSRAEAEDSVRTAQNALSFALQNYVARDSASKGPAAQSRAREAANAVKGLTAILFDEKATQQQRDQASRDLKKFDPKTFGPLLSAIRNAGLKQRIFTRGSFKLANVLSDAYEGRTLTVSQASLAGLLSPGGNLTRARMAGTVMDDLVTAMGHDYESLRSKARNISLTNLDERDKDGKLKNDLSTPEKRLSLLSAAFKAGTQVSPFLKKVLVGTLIFAAAVALVWFGSPILAAAPTLLVHLPASAWLAAHVGALASTAGAMAWSGWSVLAPVLAVGKWAAGEWSKSRAAKNPQQAQGASNAKAAMGVSGKIFKSGMMFAPILLFTNAMSVSSLLAGFSPIIVGAVVKVVGIVASTAAVKKILSRLSTPDLISDLADAQGNMTKLAALSPEAQTLAGAFYTDFPAQMKKYQELAAISPKIVEGMTFDGISKVTAAQVTEAGDRMAKIKAAGAGFENFATRADLMGDKFDLEKFKKRAGVEQALAGALTAQAVANIAKAHNMSLQEVLRLIVTSRPEDAKVTEIVKAAADPKSTMDAAGFDQALKDLTEEQRMLVELGLQSRYGQAAQRFNMMNQFAAAQGKPSEEMQKALGEMQEQAARLERFLRNPALPLGPWLEADAEARRVQLEADNKTRAEEARLAAEALARRNGTAWVSRDNRTISPKTMEEYRRADEAAREARERGLAAGTTYRTTDRRASAPETQKTSTEGSTFRVRDFRGLESGHVSEKPVISGSGRAATVSRQAAETRTIVAEVLGKTPEQIAEVRRRLNEAKTSGASSSAKTAPASVKAPVAAPVSGKEEEEDVDLANQARLFEAYFKALAAKAANDDLRKDALNVVKILSPQRRETLRKEMVDPSEAEAEPLIGQEEAFVNGFFLADNYRNLSDLEEVGVNWAQVAAAASRAFPRLMELLRKQKEATKSPESDVLAGGIGHRTGADRNAEQEKWLEGGSTASVGAGNEATTGQSLQPPADGLNKMSWWAWFNAAKEANTVDPTLWMKLRDRGLMPVVEEFVRTLSRNIPFVGPYLYPVIDVATHMAAGRAGGRSLAQMGGWWHIGKTFLKSASLTGVNLVAYYFAQKYGVGTFGAAILSGAASTVFHSVVFNMGPSASARTPAVTAKIARMHGTAAAVPASPSTPTVPNQPSVLRWTAERLANIIGLPMPKSLQAPPPAPDVQHKVLRAAVWQEKNWRRFIAPAALAAAMAGGPEIGVAQPAGSGHELIVGASFTTGLGGPIASLSSISGMNLAGGASAAQAAVALASLGGKGGPNAVSSRSWEGVKAGKYRNYVHTHDYVRPGDSKPSFGDLVAAIQIDESVWPKWLRWLRPLLPDDLVSPSVHAIAAVRDGKIVEVTTFRVRWNASVVEEVTTISAEDVGGAPAESLLADHLKKALLLGNEDTVMDGREGVPVSIYAVSPALGIESDSLRSLADATGGTKEEVIEALREARDGVPGLLEKFSTLSGDVAVVSRAHVTLFLQAMMKRHPAEALGLMGRVDGNLTEFLRDGMGVETTDGRFAPNMNGLKALLAARQSELKSAFSKEATQNARMEADGIAGSPQGKAGRTEYLRAVVKGLLQREGVGKGGVSVPSGLFAEADRRLFEAQSAENKWPAKWDVRVYSDQEEFRRAVRGEDRDGYLAVERVGRNGYRLSILTDGTDPDRDLHAAVMGAARALLFSRNPGMSTDLNKALAVRYLEEVGKLPVEGASLAAATEWRELETMKGLSDNGRPGRWLTQVFVNLFADHFGGKDGAQAMAAWKQLSALVRAPEGDGMALWLASLASASGLVEPRMVHALVMVVEEDAFEQMIAQAREHPEQLRDLADLLTDKTNRVTLSVALASAKDKQGRSPEVRFEQYRRDFHTVVRKDKSEYPDVPISPAYGALEMGPNGGLRINLDSGDLKNIPAGTNVSVIVLKATEQPATRRNDLMVDVIVFVSLHVSEVIDKLKAAIQRVRQAA
jgi:hypothetical protein